VLLIVFLFVIPEGNLRFLGLARAVMVGHFALGTKLCPEFVQVLKNGFLPTQMYQKRLAGQIVRHGYQAPESFV
jgi:hypothetical protein